MSNCPVCQTEYTEEEIISCSVCCWDLTPCPEDFLERQDIHTAWATKMWIKLQELEKPVSTEIETKAEIERHPQLLELKEQSDLQVWNLLVSWACAVDLEAARIAVDKLKEQYPAKEPYQLAHILIVQKSFQAAGIEIVKGIGVDKLLDALAGVSLPIIATLSAEMIYQIAAIYDLDLYAPERRLEVIAAFGVTCLGEQAISAGIDWMKYGFFPGMVISASAKGLMLYAIGNAACLFYEVKLNQNIDPIDSPEVFNELRQESQNYLECATTEEGVINIISSEIKVVPIKSQPNQAKRKKNKDKYGKLRKLLEAGNWKEADEETNNILFKSMGTYVGGSFGEEQIRKIPCKDLKTINYLWMNHSNGYFGFSTQRRIYNKARDGYTTRSKHNEGWLPRLLGNEYETWSDWESKATRFGQNVGWIKNGYYCSQFTFSLSASRGHLPSFTKYVVSGGKCQTFFNSIGGCLKSY